MDSLHNICTICNSTTDEKCKKCQDVRYCSAECEHTDKSHASLCAENPHDLDAPSINHRRAIFFPARDSPPTFVWVKCNNDAQPAVPTLGGFFNTSQRPPTEKFFKENLLRRRYLSPEIIYYSQHRGNIYSLPVNMNIKTLGDQQTAACQTRDWWGPVLVLGVKTQQNMIESFENLTIVNFRDVLDCLCFQLGHLPPLQANIPFEPLPKVKGVEICCAGDRRLLHKASYSSVTVPLDHPVFNSHHVSPISTSVGLPMTMYKGHVEHDPLQHARVVTNAMDLWINNEASALQMNLDPNYSALGAIPLDWQQGVGNVIMIRQDRRDLDPQHVEALVEYIQVKVSPKLAELGMGFPTPQLRDIVLGRFNRQDFKEFFGDLVEYNEYDDWRWLDVRSPF